ncbi:unnamed protein product [Paramecium octaurelia]|uniref:Uncharacterized protein n=1 Tax=Paramecium octaurelia TaxID=43137 RepID=A0A8S1U5I9_PAROT|nr:unnamed protein product [Paramecium octaurelia]
MNKIFKLIIEMLKKEAISDSQSFYHKMKTKNVGQNTFQFKIYHSKINKRSQTR